MLLSVLFVTAGEAIADPHVQDTLDLGSNVSSYPYFEFNVPRNVTTAVGQTAFLHCRVQQLGDKAVTISLTFPKSYYNVYSHVRITSIENVILIRYTLHT